MNENAIICPLRVQVGKKFVSCNLNWYRNAHYRVLNDAKKNYADLFRDIRPYIGEPPYTFTYTLYMPSKRKYDVANVGSIIDKFVCDALVKNGTLPDDNFEYIKTVTYTHGGLDRGNPRAELEIT